MQEFPTSFQGTQRKLLFLLFCLAAVFSRVVAQPQTAAPPAASSIAPTKPADAPREWKRFVGVYEFSNLGKHKATVIILERNQRAYMHFTLGPDEEIHFNLGAEYQHDYGNGFRRLGTMSVPDPNKGSWSYDIEEEPGAAPRFGYMNSGYIRIDAGSNPSAFFHIKPVEPVDQLRTSALAAEPPKEDGNFRKPDLIELAPLDPAFHLDIRYAQSNNFLSTPVYTQARAFLQRPAAEALLRVLHKLQPFGYGLLIHDAYRPWYVTKIFWDATPSKDKIFVADPQKGSKHNRGCAVDITLYDLATGKPAEMPGLYDEMSPRSFPNFPGGTSLQRWNRDLLRRAMESEGFTVNEAEWWHFDYKDWKHYPILNLRFEDLARANSN